MQLHHWFWLITYATIMMLVVLLLLRLRHSTIVSLGTQQARQEWEEWRTAARERSGAEGPVIRSVPKTSEPPALVLMRDYFPVTLGGALLFATMLFFFALFVSHGVWPAGDSAVAAGEDTMEE